MQYTFNTEAAAIIVNAINTTPIVDVSYGNATFNNGVVSFEIEDSMRDCGYYLQSGEFTVDISYFGWVDRRRILKAITKAQSEFLSVKKNKAKDAAKIRALESLNGILKGLPR